MEPPRSASREELPARFFARSAEEVAADLLGCRIVRRTPSGEERRARLVEVEAYLAGDPASHAYRGETLRNRSMFLGPGHLYVFRIHQVCCANVTTLPGEAVLLRAAEPLDPGTPPLRGPGRLARAFELTRAEDGLRLGTPAFRVLARDQPGPRVVRTGRIGLSRASERRLRFVVAGSPWASGPARARGAGS